MSVKVDVSIDLSKLPPRLKKGTGLGQFALANQVMADMNNYVPNLKTDLRNSVAIGLDGKSISYNTPYAKAQFYGSIVRNGKRIVFSRYTTPGTGPRWDLKAKAIHGNSWARVAGRAMNL